MKTNGNANKILLLGGTNSYREQRVNNKGASIKTEHQISQRRHLNQAPFHIEVDGLMYGLEKPGRNKIKHMT